MKDHPRLVPNDPADSLETYIASAGKKELRELFWFAQHGIRNADILPQFDLLLTEFAAGYGMEKESFKDALLLAAFTNCASDDPWLKRDDADDLPWYDRFNLARKVSDSRLPIEVYQSRAARGVFGMSTRSGNAAVAAMVADLRKLVGTMPVDEVRYRLTAGHEVLGDTFPEVLDDDVRFHMSAAFADLWEPSEHLLFRCAECWDICLRVPTADGPPCAGCGHPTHVYAVVAPEPSEEEVAP